MFLMLLEYKNKADMHKLHYQEESADVPCAIEETFSRVCN